MKITLKCPFKERILYYNACALENVFMFDATVSYIIVSALVHFGRLECQMPIRKCSQRTGLVSQL